MRAIDSNQKAINVFPPDFPSTFRLLQYADIYTSNITNLNNYSLKHKFYPRRGVLPHEFKSWFVWGGSQKHSSRKKVSFGHNRYICQIYTARWSFMEIFICFILHSWFCFQESRTSNSFCLSSFLIFQQSKPCKTVEIKPMIFKIELFSFIAKGAF